VITNELRKWRQTRNGKGISKAHLARKIGVTRSYVTHLENGRIQPSAETMFRIAEYFGCRIEDIFKRTDGPGAS
jgi:putative transcriptional regulator